MSTQSRPTRSPLRRRPTPRQRLPRPLIRTEPMRTLQYITVGLLFGLVALIEGCAVGPNYHTPATTMPSSFVAQSPTTRPAPAVDVTQWWKSLNDPELNTLVDR